MTNEPFAMVPLPAARSKKPRKRGMTMMMDWGLAYRRAEDYMEVLAPYVDLVKFVVGTSRLYPEDYLRRKLDLYKQNDVMPFLGGQFAEYVYATQGWDGMKPFFAEAKRLGFDALEISDNCVPLNDQERARMIGMAIDSDLEVHGEVGSKVEMQSADELIQQARVCFAAGADIVLVEGAELVANGKPNVDMLRKLRAELDLEKTLFELTGPWIKGETQSTVHQLKRFLLEEFGPDINLANVMPDDVLETEALRVGLSVTGPATHSHAAQ
ncbi:MAG: phosphosulfolactate synthase [Rhodospirillaceae bacterium]|jgi:phosphosulfolactate synthase